jgi:outer membrane protein OmpA-like peptidoglycan-associated protein
MHRFALVGLLGAPFAAHAADADPYASSASMPLGTGTLQGESPTLGAEGPTIGLTATVAEDLVIFGYEDGREAPILSELMGLELGGGWTFGHMARVDVLLPLYPYVEAPWSPFQGAAFGDARLQGTIPLMGDGDDPFQLAVVPRLGLPTGVKKGYLGRGFHGGVTAAAGGEIDKFGWVGNVGLVLSPADEIEGVTLGSTFDLLGGAWYNVEDGFRFGGEVNLSAGLASGLTGTGNTLATGHLFAQTITENGVGLTVGAGTGIVAGIGAPDYRVIAAISYGNFQRDKDKDGIVDDLDSCPIDPEDFDQFEDVDGCPESDNDKDGIVDLSDRCPLEPEDIDAFSDEDGCPELDNDMDTVVDVEDQCVLVPGLPEFAGCPDTDGDKIEDRQDACPEQPGLPEFQGCPDRDRDEVPDFRDQCPDEPKPADEDPATSDGCPKKVYITGRIIKINDKVFFESGKAVIKKESYGLLQEVAKVLQKHTWVDKVEVAGHTDDVGKDAYNLKLSQNRAQAVVDFIAKEGVAKERLVAKGYGEGSPIDTNRTEVGRQNNRRVEFNILEQSPPTLQLTPKTAPPAPPATPGKTPAATEGAAPAASPSPWGGAPAAPAESSSPWADAPARLTVNVSGAGYADVYLDEVKLSKAAPFRDFEIEPGKHTITVVNPRAGLNYTQEIVVQGGESVTVDARKGSAGPTGASPWGDLSDFE